MDKIDLVTAIIKCLSDCPFESAGRDNTPDCAGCIFDQFVSTHCRKALKEEIIAQIFHGHSDFQSE